MARTIDTIFQKIQTEKNSLTYIKDKLTNSDGSTTINTEQELLNQLQTTSKVGIWKLWAHIFSVESNFIEQNWDVYKTVLEEIRDTTQVYTAKWWTERAKEWQYGYALESLEDNSLGYSVIDESAKLVEHAATSEQPGRVILKIRRKDTNILNPTELASFESYVSKFRPLGDRIIILNYQPDYIQLYYEIFYDPFYTETIVSDVNTTINNYLYNLDFNSELNITDLTDLLQQVNGVVAPVFTSAKGKQQASTYKPFTNYYTSVAGYCTIDPAFPLGETLTDFQNGIGTIKYTPKIR